jgi:hypothetical protein
MRLSLVLLGFLAGCADTMYAYDFDLKNAGAVNIAKPGQRDTLEDADVKAEVLVDPTSFQAIVLDLTNKTDDPVQVDWNAISIISPDHTQNPLHPDVGLGAVEAHAKVSSRLIPFALPSVGGAARVYDETDFELVVPMVVRGQAREARYILHARIHKI